MKQVLLASLAAVLLSSCLKQSIVDAMMADQNSGGPQGNGGPAVATMNYAVNGNTVTNTVNDPDGQSPTAYQLGCSKGPYPGTTSTVYILDCVGSTGEMSFIFFTDSLTAGNYSYIGSYGDMYFLTYNGTAEYVHAPTDSLGFTVTSYTKGHISGTFSGRLTPMISAGNPYNTYGTSGSTVITKGSFKDVPVFY